jgi:hypothetical protein
MFSCGIFLLFLSYFASALSSGYFGFSIVEIVTLNILIDFIAIILTTLVFLYHGSRFVHQLNSGVRRFVGERDLSGSRQRQLRKAVKWIMGSAATQCAIIAGIALASRSSTAFLTPDGFFNSFVLLYFGLTTTSLAQVAAFRPLDDGKSKSRDRIASLKKTLSSTLRRPSARRQPSATGLEITSVPNQLADSSQRPVSISTGKNSLLSAMTKSMASCTTSDTNMSVHSEDTSKYVESSAAAVHVHEGIGSLGERKSRRKSAHFGPVEVANPTHGHHSASTPTLHTNPLSSPTKPERRLSAQAPSAHSRPIALFPDYSQQLPPRTQSIDELKTPLANPDPQ